MRPAELTVLVRGAGEHATGTAHRLFRCGFRVVMTEIAQPLVVRRTVSFAAAVFSGAAAVEGVTARCYESLPAGFDWSHVAVLVDPGADCRMVLRPDALIDARILKRNIDTTITDAPLVIGYGPGFSAGGNCHVAVETNRGHDLGRVIRNGETEADTGVPGVIAGYAAERCFRAPGDGIFRSEYEIGDMITAGTVVGAVDDLPVTAAISGVVRGLLYSGTAVPAGTKLGDIDPRGKRDYCFTMSDKTRCISGAAVEAILTRCGGRR